MRKRLQGLILGLIIGLLLTNVVGFGAQMQKSITALYEDIKIFVDGVKIDPKDANDKIVEPFIYEGTTYLPVRAIAQAFGKSVSWDETTKSVYIGKTPDIKPTSNVDAIKTNVDSIKTNEVFFISIQLPNDNTVYPLFMRDIGLIGNDGTCYAAQTTLYRILTMARYGYRIIDIGDDHPYFPGFNKVSDQPLGIDGFVSSQTAKSGYLYDANNMAKKYLYSTEVKADYAPSIIYNSRNYIKITDVLDFFEIPYESVTYNEKDNIIIKFKESPQLQQVPDED